MYIVIEGQDGTGKSTQARLLAEYFQSKGKTVVVMDEPDGDIPQAHDIHDLILVRGKEYNMEPLTNVLLFTASRLELWRKIAEPTLKSGGVVISARNWWSTLAYQGYGEGVSKERIIKITKEIMPKLYTNPEKSVILTVPDEVRLSRQQNRGKATETFEAKNNDFQHKVNHAYLAIAKKFNIPVLDASPSPEEIQKNLLKLFEI